MGRTKDFLINDLEEVKIFYQYLYLDENAFVDVGTKTSVIRIRMDEEGRFKARNLTFPHHSEMEYSQVMTIPVILGVIDQLKRRSSDIGYGNFSSKWEEIKKITLTNLSLNMPR